MANPKKWWEVYQGSDENKLFRALARSKFDWRSTKALSKETGLTPERVEQIIQKYLKMGIVFQSPTNEDNWGYWERVPQMLPKNQKSVSKADQNDRLKKAMNCGVNNADAQKSVGFSAGVRSEAGPLVAAEVRMDGVADMDGSSLDGVYELKALAPASLKSAVLQKAMDLDPSGEISQQIEDAVFLCRQTVLRAVATAQEQKVGPDQIDSEALTNRVFTLMNERYPKAMTFLGQNFNNLDALDSLFVG